MLCAVYIMDIGHQSDHSITCHFLLCGLWDWTLLTKQSKTEKAQIGGLMVKVKVDVGRIASHDLHFQLRPHRQIAALPLHAAGRQRTAWRCLGRRGLYCACAVWTDSRCCSPRLLQLQLLLLFLLAQHHVCSPQSSAEQLFPREFLPLPEQMCAEPLHRFLPFLPLSHCGSAWKDVVEAPVTGK